MVRWTMAGLSFTGEEIKLSGSSSGVSFNIYLHPTQCDYILCKCQELESRYHESYQTYVYAGNAYVNV